MKKYLSLAFVLAIPGVAHAQEQAQAFSGFYAGVEGGYDNYELSADIDLGDLDPSFAGTSATFDGLSANGMAGGVFAGYQFGFGGGFVGVEGFGRYSDAGMSVTATDGIDSVSLSAKARESYGVAARIGAKVARSTGIYGRLGWLNTKFKTRLDDGVDVYTASATEDAIQYGAGLETMVGPRMTLRAEYVIADYGQAGIATGVDLDSGSFSAGLAFRY